MGVELIFPLHSILMSNENECFITRGKFSSYLRNQI